MTFIRIACIAATTFLCGCETVTQARSIDVSSTTAETATNASINEQEARSVTGQVTKTQFSAKPEDVASLDAIMMAIYDVISGPAGQERDWDRFESLFVEGARLIPYAPDSEKGITALTPAEYRDRAGPFFLENGFYEAEIGRKVQRYGNIAHVLSAYDSKRTPEDVEPFARGINSFQLMEHAGRWWVVTIYWQSEGDDNPIPEDMLN